MPILPCGTRKVGQLPSAMNEGGSSVGLSARKPSRLRAALTARISLLVREVNVKKSAGRQTSASAHLDDGDQRAIVVKSNERLGPWGPPSLLAQRWCLKPRRSPHSI
jgi:hypothetical protein